MRSNGKKMQNEPIAHLFQHAGPHLCKNIVPLVLEVFPTAVIYMKSPFPTGNKGEFVSEANREWIDKIPVAHFGGYLEYSGVWKLFKGKLGRKIATVLSNTLIPKYSWKSWKLVWKGPRRWVYHSCLPMNIPTQFVFWLMRKQVVAIHWGLPLGHIKYIWPLVNLAHNFARKIFVLMTPEVGFFRPFILRDKINVLPYPAMSNRFAWENYKPTLGNKVMILGNSTYNRDWYGPVLEKIPVGSWDKIICMLNYGRENEKDITDAFVDKYRIKFGDTFVAWRESVPYDEYIKIMQGASFYIGPSPVQSGLGAIYNMIAMGKTLIIRGHNYQWLTELGCTVLNLDQLSDLSYESLSMLKMTPEVCLSNFSKLNYFFEKVNNPSFWAHSIWHAFQA